jgi:chitinase
MIANLVDLALQYELDGIDIDDEFTSMGPSALNCTIFMTDLSSALHAVHKQLTAAVVAYGTVGDSFLPEALAALDGLNVMEYENTDGGTRIVHTVQLGR